MDRYHLYPSDVSNAGWKIISKLVPAAKHGGRPRTLDMRLAINAIFYVVTGGIQWRMLPREYPKWQSVYHYFRQWRNDGTWQRIHDTLRAQVREQEGRHKHPTAGSVDSQSVKTVQIAGIRGFDNGKKVKGRKRHILIDTMGLITAVIVTAASVSDPAGAKLLFKRLSGSCKKLRRIWVDGAYRGKLLGWVTERFHFVLQPVLRNSEQKGFVLLPRRWVVELTFAWLNLHRRLSKDYEVFPETSETMIRIAMIRIMLNRFTV